MKKLFLIIVIGLIYFANISAQNEFEVKRNGNIVNTKTMSIVRKVSPELLKKYDEKKIIQAWQKDKIEVDKKISFNYNVYGTQRQKKTTITFLQKRENEIVEVATTKNGNWQLAWEIFLFWLLPFIVIKQCKTQWEKFEDETDQKEFGMPFFAIVTATIGVMLTFTHTFINNVTIANVFIFVAISIIWVWILISLLGGIDIPDSPNASWLDKTVKTHRWLEYNYLNTMDETKACFEFINAFTIIVVYLGSTIGWFLCIGLRHKWIPLFIYISIFIISIFFEYFYTNRKKKKEIN